MYRRFFKRFLDIVLSALGLIIFSPLMLLVAVLIYLDDGGPILFWQKRVGKGGALFMLCKFRSMPVNTGDVEAAKAAGLTITRVGRIIRRTNIDEIPQLINVLRGDMSIVGPRPPLPSQENLVSMRKQNGAIQCTPGLTGLAQVNGYTGMPDAEKASFDGEYAATVNFFRDAKIILKTFGYLRKPPPVY